MTTPTPPTVPQQNGSLEQQAKNAEEMRENLLIALENAIKLDELEGQKAEKLGQQLKLTQRRLDVSTKLLRQTASTLNNMIAQKDSLQQTVASADELKGILDIVSKKQVEGVQAGAEYNKILENMRRINQEAGTDDAKRLQLLRESAKAMEELRAEMEDVKKFGDSFNNSLSGWGSKLGVANNLMSTSSGQIGSMVADLTTGLTTDKIAMVGKAFQQFGVTILASVVDEVFKLAIALDTLGKEFKKTNGYAQDFENTIAKIDSNLYAAGISTEKSVAAMQSLSDIYSDYNPNAVLQNEYMTTSIGLLTSVGVEANHSAKGIQMLSKSFKTTGEQSTDTFMKIITSGNAAGISNKRMAADFEANFASLVQFGDKAIEVFKELAATAKATGVEMGSLVGIAQKFDTFEGAATQAAKLNSVLGSNVSALELMNADYAETIELIQDGLSGVNFGELNRFEQQYIAQAMGAKDVYEAQRLLSGQADEYESKMKVQAETQDELMRIVKKQLPVMDRLTTSIGKIARALGIVLTPLRWFIDLLLFIDDATGQILLPLTMMGGAIYGIYSWIAGLGAVVAAFEAGAIGTWVGVVLSAVEVGGMAVAGLVGILLMFAGAWTMASNWLREGEVIWNWLIYLFDAIVIGATTAAAAFLLFSNPIGWVVALVSILSGVMFAFRNELAELFDTWTLSGSPKLYDMPGYFAAGMDAMDMALDRAAVAVKKFGIVLLEVYKLMFLPFIEGFKFIGGMLGFNVESSEEPTAPTVQEVGALAGGRKPAAAIQQAATEVKTLVVAQLKETGIQETANELAKIAKAMQGKEPVTNVSVNIDGRSLSDFVMRTITG